MASLDSEEFRGRLAGTPRVLVGVHGDRASPPSEPLHVMLSPLFATVRLAYLPNPHVPWLEPLDGVSPASPVIASCWREAPSDIMGGDT